MAWNPCEAGFLLSGSSDNVVCLWDVNHLDKSRSPLAPLSVFKHHTGSVEDVDWNSENPRIAVSVGDDKVMLFMIIKNHYNNKL